MDEQRIAPTLAAPVGSVASALDFEAVSPTDHPAHLRAEVLLVERVRGRR